MKQALLLLCLVLSACGTHPPLPARPAIGEITVFAFTGRLAVRQGEARHHVRIDWRHAPGHDTILLTTPLGQGVAEITRDASGAHLTLADRRQFSAANWDDLSEQVFGFHLPLSSSTRWLQGDTTDMQGWRLLVTDRESADPQALPTVLEFERDDISVRLKVDEWSEAR